GWNREDSLLLNLLALLCFNLTSLLDQSLSSSSSDSLSMCRAKAFQLFHSTMLPCASLETNLPSEKESKVFFRARRLPRTTWSEVIPNLFCMRLIWAASLPKKNHLTPPSLSGTKRPSGIETKPN